jgi:hypothetical protein
LFCCKTHQRLDQSPLFTRQYRHEVHLIPMRRDALMLRPPNVFLRRFLDDKSRLVKAFEMVRRRGLCLFLEWTYTVIITLH